MITAVESGTVAAGVGSERGLVELHQVQGGGLHDLAARREFRQHGLGEEARGGDLAFVERRIAA